MNRLIRKISSCLAVALWVQLAGCATVASPTAQLQADEVAAALPATFATATPGVTAAELDWREFFADPGLIELIDAALANNQELNILLQEIEVSRAAATARSGEYLPFVTLEAGAGTEKVGEFTREGAVEKNLPLREGKEFPEPLPEFGVAARMSWEVDIWKRLRNEQQAAVLRYLATEEGRNFMITQLVAEIAETYYELLALDNRLDVLERMLDIQQAALEVMKLQKQAAKTTELAVRRFEAEMLKNQSQLFGTRQRIVETENRLNYLAGRYPQPITRDARALTERSLRELPVGLPSDLLVHRPDIRRAELELAAAELEIRAARARFYPSLDLSLALGVESADFGELLTTPASLLYGIAGDLAVPLLNRRGLQAAYAAANAEQLQALYGYQQTVLHAYTEVLNQMALIRNLNESHARTRQQVEILNNAVDIANRLFRSARADYAEVLLTQRDALESRLELIELRQQQFTALVGVYQALGGGYARSAESESTSAAALAAAD